MSKLKEIADKALDTINVKEVFVTSDDQVFLSENYARLHAKDKKLRLTRFERQPVVDIEVQAEQVTGDKPVVYDELKKADLHELLLARGIEIPKKATNKDLIALLEAADAAAKGDAGVNMTEDNAGGEGTDEQGEGTENNQDNGSI